MIFLIKKDVSTLNPYELKCRNLLKNPLSGICIIGFKTYYITEINDQACRNIGYTKQEIL